MMWKHETVCSVRIIGLSKTARRGSENIIISVTSLMDDPYTVPQVVLPVSRSLLEAWYCFSSLMSLQCMFFNLWPSSTTMYLHDVLRNTGRSFIAISYDVTKTGRTVRGVAKESIFLTSRRRWRITSRSFWLPWYNTTGISGAKVLK